MMSPRRALAGHRGSFDLQQHSVLERMKIQSPSVDRSLESLVEIRVNPLWVTESLMAALCLISPVQEKETAKTCKTHHPAQPGVVILGCSDSPTEGRQVPAPCAAGM